jgi:hypothetical protein
MATSLPPSARSKSGPSAIRKHHTMVGRVVETSSICSAWALWLVTGLFRTTPFTVFKNSRLFSPSVPTHQRPLHPPHAAPLQATRISFAPTHLMPARRLDCRRCPGGAFFEDLPPMTERLMKAVWHLLGWTGLRKNERAVSCLFISVRVSHSQSNRSRWQRTRSEMLPVSPPQFMQSHGVGQEDIDPELHSTIRPSPN